MPRISTKPIQLLKGFKDILPEHQKYWEFFIAKALPLLNANGFEKIDVPILEQTNLFVKGTGRHTDVVEKELYSFQDKGDDNVTIRPEFTPGICRAYIEHGMLNKPQPVKLYSIGPVLRHDNPQSGRYRQFNQLNLEAIGSDSPVLDAQLIIIAYRLLESIGLSVTVHLNSIGCPECRAEFIIKLKQYLSTAGRKKELCESCKIRYTKNPLRILDCKQETCQEITADAPQIVDYLDDGCKKHFMAVLEYLDDLEIKYNLNVRLVRGLDYYTHTTFEIYLSDEDPSKSQGSLIGGGRYDGLIEIIGGRPTPAVGFAAGIERIISRIRELKIEVPEVNKHEVFIAQLGVEARKECFKLHQKLLDEGIKVGESFNKDGLKAQLERADQMGIKLALILGQKELMDKTIIIRDMQSGIQEIVNYDKTVEQVKKRLDPNVSSVKSYRIKTSPDQTETPAEGKEGVSSEPTLNQPLTDSNVSDKDKQEEQPGHDKQEKTDVPPPPPKRKKPKKSFFKADDADDVDDAEVNNLNHINEL